jgi:hypothetical protein
MYSFKIEIPKFSQFFCEKREKKIVSKKIFGCECRCWFMGAKPNNLKNGFRMLIATNKSNGMHVMK